MNYFMNIDEDYTPHDLYYVQRDIRGYYLFFIGLGPFTIW